MHGLRVRGSTGSLATERIDDERATHRLYCRCIYSSFISWRVDFHCSEVEGVEDDSKSEVFAATEAMVGAASRLRVVDRLIEREELEKPNEVENTEDFIELIDVFGITSTVSWQHHV